MDFLISALKTPLAAGQKVLWLIAGGSAIDIAVEAAKKLGNAAYLTNLSVSLTDERYGPVSHPDSNWQQLLNKGFWLPGAQLYPVLKSDNLEDTAHQYSNLLNREIQNCDYSLALAGMGPDGHILGIMPGSPAVDSPKDVISYEWDDYTRLTPTFRLMKKLDEIVVYAVGEAKHAQLDDLDTNLPARQQPAQLLKDLPKVTIFNDYKGDLV